MTYCDAEKVIRDGSYKSLPDEVLQEMMLACMSVTGHNQSALLRIHAFADLIKTELASRDAFRGQKEHSADLSPAMEVTPVSFPNTDAAGQTGCWNETKLTKLIQDKIEESLTLEFKAAGAIARDDKKKFDITKDVSSMANSAGGLLIYGVAEFHDTNRKHLPERLDPIDRVEFAKEWIEHIVSQIRPRIPGIIIYPVELNSGPNHVAYVIEIPEGRTAHQANDYRYYRRYNFESVPMADHEVRDVMNRKTHPSVFVEARFVLYSQRTDAGHDGGLCLTIINTSDVLARYVGISLNVPTRFRGKLIYYDNATIEEIGSESSYRLTYCNHHDAPLFPHGALNPRFNFKRVSHMNPEPPKEIGDFRYVVFADSMPKQLGTFTLDQILISFPNRHKLTS
jgi:hypothetical protein